MSGPETRFYTAIHRKLPKTLHREKMHNAYRGGTADVWYSGNADDLWVEYKWLAKLPKKSPVRLDKLLSPLQQRWLSERHKEGRNIVVILGAPTGAWVLEGVSWRQPLDPDTLQANKLTKHEVAEYIQKRTTLNDVLANPRHPDQQLDLPFIANGNDDCLSS